MGIDPSLCNFGVAIGEVINGSLIIDKLLLFQTSKSNKKPKPTAGEDDIRRAIQIIEFIRRLPRYDLIFAEIPTGSQSARSAKSAGICLGILAGIENLRGVTPVEVKQAAGLKRTATKAEMIHWAKSLYPNLNWYNKLKDEHLADAIAVIHAGLKSNGMLY